MYPLIFKIHSLLRFVVLILLVIVILKSLAGWFGKKDFHKSDEKLPLFLLISAHLQLLLGLGLYFLSPFVQFNGQTMKEATTRYWTVEHITMMVIAIALITVSKSSLKRLTTAESKHKRLAIFNIIALVIILAAIWMSKRGLFTVTGM
jgi:hypothetical protein